MRSVLAFLTVAAFCLVVVPVRAEKANLSPKELRETATHVAAGQVVAIYERTETKENWKYVRYVAELRVEASEKGDGVAKGDLLYVRYWTRSWAGPGVMPPSTNGHRGLPNAGETIRVYLARNAYDGFSKENTDGGFNVIGANGFEKP
jgi:hypothetical protein